jgi:hypothetical protein
MDSDGLKALAKALKRKKASNPHLPNSDSEADDLFDVRAAMQTAGFPDFDRPEHIPPAQLARMKEQADRHFTKARPFVSPATSNILKHFGPQASAIVHRDPTKAKARQESRARAFESPTQLYRHLMTWGLSHTAVDAMDLPSLIAFVLSIMEIDDNHGFQTAQQYSLSRLNQLKDTIDLQANPSGTGTSDITAAKSFTGQFLRKTDEHLLASLVTTRPSGTTGGPKRDQGDHPGAGDTTKPNGGTPRLSKPDNQQICFDHRPHDSRPCARPNCARQHLDTSKPDQRTRFDAALKTFEDNKAARTAKRRRPDT